MSQQDNTVSVEEREVMLVWDGQVHSSENPGTIQLRLSRPLRDVVRVQLMEALIDGVPVTSGIANYPFFFVSVSPLVSTVSAAQTPAAGTREGELVLPLAGSRTHHIFSPPMEVSSGDDSLFNVSHVTVSVTLPSGAMATRTELTALLLRFRLMCRTHNTAPRSAVLLGR